MTVKLKYVTLLAILIPSIAMAAFFEGSFVGINAGIAQTKEQISHTMEGVIPLPNGAGAPPTILDIVFTDGNPSKITDMGFIGGLNLGYSYPLTPCVLVGIDARAYLLDFKMTHRFTGVVPLIGGLAEFATKVGMTQQYTALAKIGWLLYPQTQVYGLVGPQFGVFHIHVIGDVQVAFPNGGGGITATHDESKTTTKWGYLLGLGMEHMITEHSSIGLEYNFANYLSLSFPKVTHSNIITAGGFAAGADITANNSIKMLTSATFVKYNYYFDC